MTHKFLPSSSPAKGAQEQIAVLLIKGAITELSEEERASVMSSHARLKSIVDETGDHGLIALALLGAELQAEEAARG